MLCRPAVDLPASLAPLLPLPRRPHALAGRLPALAGDATRRESGVLSAVMASTLYRCGDGAASDWRLGGLRSVLWPCGVNVSRRWCTRCVGAPAPSTLSGPPSRGELSWRRADGSYK